MSEFIRSVGEVGESCRLIEQFLLACSPLGISPREQQVFALESRRNNLSILRTAVVLLCFSLFDHDL